MMPPVTQHSAIYEGWVRHRRFTPVEHSFQYPMYLMYLDLDELPRVFQGRWFWGVERRACAQFRRRDHFGDADKPLIQSVRELLRQEGFHFDDGPVRLLTHLRYFGYVFNPVSFFFCFSPDENLRAVVAEVNNTPWGERHCYVVDGRAFSGSPTVSFVEKRFHVSPFMEMDQRYRWHLRSPGSRLVMHMENEQEGQTIFDVTMNMTRRELTGQRLAMSLVRFPLMTQRVIAAIYWQALRLWWKGCPYVPHPTAREGGADAINQNPVVVARTRQAS